ncbi:restriction endonuclease subunit S [Nostoc commune]|uniref:restriction endonuclease subunit S n=1 Tax=Nostoc commune TaxID=1178 RepID=UPI0018C75C1A|nr:restriction endonuclease subunit S [Nostoc commune]MBG1264644.1 hypothetical protein [Nostoc commune BAE]
MNWQMLPFAKVAEVITGNTPSKKEPENYGYGIPWVKPHDLEAWEPITKTEETLSEIGQKKSRLIPPGSVMVCCIGSIGKVGIAGTKLATNQQINSLIFKPEIEPKFGYYYCCHILPIFKSEARQAVVSILNKSNFEKITIPVPAISEQRRIVQILDQADALRRMRAEADVKGDRILPALFIKMFGEPSTWTDINTETLGSLVNIQSGGTPSKKNPDYWDGDIPWVSPKDMKQDIIFDSIDHISQKAIEETNIKYVEPGAILIVVRGMILAHTIPIALAATRLTINQDMKALYPDCNYIDSTYLHSALKASSRKILSQVGTAGHGTRKFDTDELLNLQILIPSQEQLKKFQIAVTECRASLTGINRTKEKLEKLFDVLLYRAFSGELTAKWREAHMKELLTEMEEQAKALKCKTDSNYKQLIL